MRVGAHRPMVMVPGATVDEVHNHLELRTAVFCRMGDTIGVRDRGQGGATAHPPNFGKPRKFGQMLGKINKIRIISLQS